MKSTIITTWSLVLFFFVAAAITGCEQPQLKEGVVSVTGVSCVSTYDTRQKCTVTVLTRDTTRLYNAKHIQVLVPGEQFVPSE